MSLEGGDDYAASDAIGGCMGCGLRGSRLYNGHCSTCAGIPPPPEPSRLECLRASRRTFEIAITKTGDPFKRAAYRKAADRLAAAIEEEA